MLRKFLIAVLFVGAIAPAVADTECPMGWGYTTLVDVAIGGCVDLGTLDWNVYHNDTYNKNMFYVKMDDVKPLVGEQFYSTEFHGSSTLGSASSDYEDGGGYMSDTSGVGLFRCYADKYNNMTTQEFKQAMSGVILYYQRATDSSWTPPQDDTVCQFDTSSYEPYGEYVLPEIHGCTLCPSNTYKDTVGNTECTPCPSGTMSPAGAKSIDQCGHILHVGNYNIFMPVGRRTEHGLCAMLDGVKYCADVYERE